MRQTNENWTLDQDDSMGTVWMSIMPCDCVCSYGASKAVWQELIRTKKQLETTDLELDQLNLEKYDIEDELDRTRKAFGVAFDWLEQVATPEKCDDDLCREFTKRKLIEIKTALE